MDTSSGHIVYLSKKIKFSAAHRLNSKHFSEEENRDVYGKCNGIHGHNYNVKVTFRGRTDPKTGYFINVADINDYLKAVVEKLLDHKFLDEDIDFFKENVSTMENICLFIWNGMKSLMEKPDLLYEVKVKESDNNSAYYRGEST